MPYEEFQEFERVLGRMGQEIKQQVMQIRDAEKRYRNIFENAMEGIFQTSSDGGSLLSINPALARMLGYDSPGEMLSQENSQAIDFYADPSRREDLLNHLRKDGYANDI